MRKLSRRTTIFMVALGVLLTASIAIAGMAVDGSLTFQVQTADDTTPPPPPEDLIITVERLNEDAGPISEDQRARYKIVVTNPNEEDVILADPAVTFAVDAGEGSECDLDDLRFNDPDELNGATVPGNDGQVSDEFSVKLRDGSGPDCDDVLLSITVTVNGETVDPPAPVEGSSSV